jgi:predicted MFS family arabinose efflux permease
MEGFNYLRGSRDLKILMGLASVGGVFGFSAMRTLLSVLAAQTFHSGSEVFGGLYACYGAGALFGGLLTAKLARASFGRLLVGAATFNATILLLAPLRSPILAGLLLIVIGGAWTTWSSQAQSMIQLAAPDRLRGRVIGLYTSALLVGVPFGGLLGGWLATVGGTRLAFGVAGGIGLAATGLAAVSFRRRRVESLPGAVVAGEGGSAS